MLFLNIDDQQLPLGLIADGKIVIADLDIDQIWPPDHGEITPCSFSAALATHCFHRSRYNNDVIADLGIDRICHGSHRAGKESHGTFPLNLRSTFHQSRYNCDELIYCQAWWKSTRSINKM